MTPFLRNASTIAAVVIFSPFAMAHTGHGADHALHYIAEPVHQFQSVALVMAIIIVTTLGLVSARRKKLGN